jgi:hypothetical protein
VGLRDPGGHPHRDAGPIDPPVEPEPPIVERVVVPWVEPPPVVDPPIVEPHVVDPSLDLRVLAPFRDGAADRAVALDLDVGRGFLTERAGLRRTGFLEEVRGPLEVAEARVVERAPVRQIDQALLVEAARAPDFTLLTDLGR